MTFKLLLKRYWSIFLRNIFKFKPGDLVIYLDNEWNYGILQQGSVYSINSIGYTGFFVTDLNDETKQYFASEDCFIPYYEILANLLGG